MGVGMVPLHLILLLVLGTLEQVPICQVVLAVMGPILGDVSVLHTLVLHRLGHPIPRLSMGGFERGADIPSLPRVGCSSSSWSPFCRPLSSPKGVGAEV